MLVFASFSRKLQKDLYIRDCVIRQRKGKDEREGNTGRGRREKRKGEEGERICAQAIYLCFSFS